ncbi:MAG: hypothetical protein E7442_03420 [Ruminococcaceae bacterium]|nr:hypothetical protein [Oscillospiraceae bacterium]
METKEKKENRRKLAAAGTAVVTAGALMVSGLFGEPAEIMEEDAAEGIVDTEVMEEGSEENGEERRGLRQRLRERILALPMVLRLTVILPLWGLGWGLMQLLPLFIRPLGLGAAMMGAAAGAAKLLRPDLPLKTLFRRRSFGIALLAVGLLYAANALLPLVWENYERFSMLVSAALTLGGGTVLLWPYARNIEEPPREETMAEARRHVLAMADEAGKH